jgi:hypothetical protein
MGDSAHARVPMGVAALGLVLIVDFPVGRWIGGLAPAGQIRHVSTVEGMACAAALMRLAAIPALVHILGGR